MHTRSPKTAPPHHAPLKGVNRMAVVADLSRPDILLAGVFDVVERQFIIRPFAFQTADPIGICGGV